MPKDETIINFLDFLMSKASVEEIAYLVKAYQEWNRRPGGALEGKPLPKEDAA